MLMRHRVSVRVVQVDAADDVSGGDHVETVWKLADDIAAEMLRCVLLVAVAEGLHARLPAPAVIAAGERAVGVKELVVGVGFPVRRFAPAGNHDTGAITRHAGLGLYGGSEMHQKADRSDDAGSMIDKANQLTQIRSTAQIDHA